MTKYIAGSGKTGRINHPRARKNPPRSFTPWQRVEYHGWDEVVHVPGLGPCWETRAPRRRGYGVIGHGTGNYLSTHRVSYEHHHGPIPETLLVRHRCDNPPCVNPEHLLLGTHADNAADMVARNRQARADQMLTPLTEAQVREIKAKLAEKAEMKPLAREYDVSRNTIRKIARGETWNWV